MTKLQSPDKFPGWPSKKAKEVLQLSVPVAEIGERLKHHMQPGQRMATVNDDGADGLGPFTGAHVVDPQIGPVAFLSYAEAPTKGAYVLVDEKAPTSAAVRRLKHILDLRPKDVEWKLDVSQDRTSPKAPVVTTIPLSVMIAELAKKSEMPKSAVAGLLGDFAHMTVKHLKKGNKVRITGLGILQVRRRPARMGRNPATGEVIKIKASKKVAFRAAKDLKESV